LSNYLFGGHVEQFVFNIEDVYRMIAITANQAIAAKANK